MYSISIEHNGLWVCLSKGWVLSPKIFLAPCHPHITKKISLKPPRAPCGFYQNALFSSILDLSVSSLRIRHLDSVFPISTFKEFILTK